MLCRQLAQEWAADGIRVNAVCPGMIRTPLTEAVYQDADVAAQREALVPLARIGRGEDVAAAVAYLASAGAAYVTGQQLVVDGGVADRMLALIPGRALTGGVGSGGRGRSEIRMRLGGARGCLVRQEPPGGFQVRGVAHAQVVLARRLTIEQRQAHEAHRGRGRARALFGHQRESHPFLHQLAARLEARHLDAHVERPRQALLGQLHEGLEGMAGSSRSVLVHRLLQASGGARRAAPAAPPAPRSWMYGYEVRPGAGRSVVHADVRIALDHQARNVEAQTLDQVDARVRRAR